ncbi:DUF6909 family protein [Bacteroidetes bacterium endosymbiont of Geopemphigus sp.]|uniref:DUF6909 family protein n=1 Tax=Bacteroidetes bacterium endosymbiont of Geopemphigus sp. TaxID=2047937 RepID=UPI000CD0EBED|nr:hypothetical protein [Bacteroidetes bacterium endosymbiont of Geopemphigus sp.]
MPEQSLSKAKQSSNAIERLQVTMRYLFNRGAYKPNGPSGQTLKELLLLLRPEIYGDMVDKEKVELKGLIYIMDRLPNGIEGCRYIHLTTDEGYLRANFHSIIPPKRRRNCYRIDDYQMNIEITRGRSEVYDLLTHLTFLFIEGQKIMDKAYTKSTKKISREWKFLEHIALSDETLTSQERKIGLIHLSTLLGRTFQETLEAEARFSKDHDKKQFFKIIYHLGQLSIDELLRGEKRVISFSPTLRERIGHHFYGETWAHNIKKTLIKKQQLSRGLHIISANMHGALNSFYARKALGKDFKDKNDLEIYKKLSQPGSHSLREIVSQYARANGTVMIDDHSGANINVQIIDLKKVDLSETAFESIEKPHQKDLLIVMDYAFGEQAYEVMDELLKPCKDEKQLYKMNIKSISIMGKAGILDGKKGDIMVPDAHIFEGSADNYPIKNALSGDDFRGARLGVCEGLMVTVLGTSLQNKDLLKYFKNSSWGAIGLEMEGAHYQKAIQSAVNIRRHLSEDIVLRYAYYASDNPLESGSTLASGGLGLSGVKPTYLITQRILEQILSGK